MALSHSPSHTLTPSHPHPHSYNMEQAYPEVPMYEQPPPPYTSPTPPLTTGTTHTFNHTHINLLDNGHALYSVVTNGSSGSSLPSLNGTEPPPPLPPARDSALDPDHISPYADSGTYSKAKPDSHADSNPEEKGQSSDNPLYASCEELEPVYSKIAVPQSTFHQS